LISGRLVHVVFVFFQTRRHLSNAGYQSRFGRAKVEE
jgi:hypothetical protein